MIKTNYTENEKKEIIKKYIKYLSFKKTHQVKISKHKKTEKAVYITVFISDFRDIEIISNKESKQIDTLEKKWNFDVSFWIPKKLCFYDSCGNLYTVPTWLLIKKLEELVKN
jgi:hypothetical protein